MYGEFEGGIRLTDEEGTIQYSFRKQTQHQIMYAFVDFVKKDIYQTNIIIDHIWRYVKCIKAI